MRERGIIFSGEMVKALLDGRKTQTRRLLKLPAGCELDGVTKVACGNEVYCHAPGEKVGQRILPWRYVPGERLWVRETWAPVERKEDNVDGIRFRADDAFVRIKNTRQAAERWVVAANNDHSGRWRSPLYMPRWASRITLQVDSVRVERLRDITEEDARAEGVETGKMQPAVINGERGQVMIFDPRKAYAVLWDQLHGQGSFATNPWVWVVSFRRVEAKP